MLTDSGPAIDQSALEDLAALLLERAGLKISPDGFYGLRLALRARMPALGISDSGDYVHRLRQAAGEHELRSLLPLVTVGKTDFFRDGRQFHALEARIMPDALLEARHARRRVQIWSAGCATGEEPYSLAIVAAELGARPKEIEIWATDLNAAAVESAKVGRYPGRRVAGLTEARLARYFTPFGDGYEVSPTLRELVRFEGQNLAAPVFAKVLPGSIDVILCRNVIIYFDLPTIRGLMDRFFVALRPGGLLLLGYSESLFKVYDKFQMVEIEGSFIYRRPKPGERATDIPGLLGSALKKAEPPPKAHGHSKAAKPHKRGHGEKPAPVRRAPAASARAARAEPAVHQSPAERLEAAMARSERGEFDEALAEVKQLIEAEDTDLDAWLTLGNLNSLMGHAAEARDAFTAALAIEPLCVEARIFGGVAALQIRDLSGARAELQKALFLEPTLSLGHYLLAQVFEQSGAAEEARRAYRNALAQLRFPQRELAGHYPDMPDSPETIARAARYALAALEER